MSAYFHHTVFNTRINGFSFSLILVLVAIASFTVRCDVKRVVEKPKTIHAYHFFLVMILHSDVVVQM